MLRFLAKRDCLKLKHGAKVDYFFKKQQTERKIFEKFLRNKFFCFFVKKKKETMNSLTTQEMKSIIAEYFKTQPVLKAWIFGSYARGEERPDSDVDILVEFDHNTPI